MSDGTGTTGAMNDLSAIDAAAKRLVQALDALDAALERRRVQDHASDALASQLHALGNRSFKACR